MDVQIPEDDLNGFNPEAKKKLREATEGFVGDLIEEANRLESSANTAGDDPQITSSMVNDAETLIRRGLVKPKKRWGVKILRVFSVILALAVGWLYNASALRSAAYMLFFIFILAVMIICVTVSTFVED